VELKGEDNRFPNHPSIPKIMKIYWGSIPHNSNQIEKKCKNMYYSYPRYKPTMEEKK